MNKEEKKLLHYKNTHKEVEGIIYKQCSICKEWFPENLDNFYKKKDKLSPYCKECERSKNYNWLIQNYDKHPVYMKNDYTKRKDKYLESANKQRESGYSKEWLQNNPDKVKQYGEKYSNKAHKINKNQWLSCKEYFNNECAYCGLPIDKHYIKLKGEIRLGDFHKEHVNCNGSDGLENCIPACKKCNTSKHTENMEEWYKRQEFFNEDKLNKIHKWLNDDYKQYIQDKPRKEYTKRDITYWNKESNITKSS